MNAENYTRKSLEAVQTAQAMALAGARMIQEPETMAKIRKEFDEMPK